MSRTLIVDDKNSIAYNFNIGTPIMTKFLHGIATMNGPSWVVSWFLPTNPGPRWQTAAVLNFVKCYPY